MLTIMGRWPLLGMMLLLGGCGAGATTDPVLPLDPGQSSRCLSVYSAATYHLHQTIAGCVFPWPRQSHELDKDDTADLRAGTGLVAEVGGRRFVVTAAHVVGRTRAEGQAVAQAIGRQDGADTTLRGGSVRIRVSSLAYTPQRIYVDYAADVAVLEMSADFWEKLAVLAFQVPPDLPAMEQTVRVWGFPKTPVPQLKTGARVIAANQEMVVLNEPLDPGYSGGPVLSGDGDRLLGMVARSSDSQSRAVPGARIRQAIQSFDEKAVAYGGALDLAR